MSKINWQGKGKIEKTAQRDNNTFDSNICALFTFNSGLGYGDINLNVRRINI